MALVRERAVAAARRIVGRHPGEAVAVVSHAIPIRSILADALGMQPERCPLRIDQVCGGISVIDWFGEQPLVRSVNGRH